ncbi:MAG: PIN domain-containing protein [Anaerolineales bacterium]|nr:PIN domain-containing protein [Anaerolineales bacterium]
MPPILIDTNVLLYLYDVGSPQKATQAQNVLEQLGMNRSGRLSVQNLAEFFHVSTRKLDPPLTIANALEQVHLFMSIYPVFDLTPLIVIEAARGYRDHGLAYYDSQIWATAKLNQVAVIFSEDFNDGQILEGVRFVNPFSEKFRLEDWL